MNILRKPCPDTRVLNIRACKQTALIGRLSTKGRKQSVTSHRDYQLTQPGTTIFTRRSTVGIPVKEFGDKIADTNLMFRRKRYVNFEVLRTAIILLDTPVAGKGRTKLD
jgi:hypothetical protein